MNQTIKKYIIGTLLTKSIFEGWPDVFCFSTLLLTVRVVIFLRLKVLGLKELIKLVYNFPCLALGNIIYRTRERMSAT